MNKVIVIQNLKQLKEIILLAKSNLDFSKEIFHKPNQLHSNDLSFTFDMFEIYHDTILKLRPFKDSPTDSASFFDPKNDETYFTLDLNTWDVIAHDFNEPLTVRLDDSIDVVELTEKQKESTDRALLTMSKREDHSAINIYSHDDVLNIRRHHKNLSIAFYGEELK